MENLFYKKFLFGVFILFSISVLGQNKVNREIKKNYAFSHDGTFYLDNKYGDVFINGWDKDSIKILIKVEVKGKNIEKANDLLKRIKSNIVSTKSQVIVKSKIEEKETSFFNKYINKIDPFKNEKSNTSINYTVYLPKYANVEVLNKYGDIIVSGWNGKLNADVEHGDLRLTDSIATSTLSVKYGKLRANILNKTKIKAKDASVSFNYSSVLKLETEGSTIAIDTVGKLDINSNKDDLVINKTNNTFGKVKYSKIVFNTITTKANLNLYLAELRVLNFKTKNPIVNIQQKSSEVYINISNTNFNFEAELEQGVLRIPKSMHNIKSKVLDEKNKIRQIQALYGTKTKGVFNITGYKGVIIFKEL
ncbi:hypothetical protein [Algibacter sp. PT7-4]|uniref:hypothetical protein n=1 Tax=Algibacter ulvanivorans TaxID=3400999 RepID=UPI003AAEEFC6